MKKRIFLLAASLALAGGCLGMAEEAQTDTAVTNVTSPYPVVDSLLPAVPVPPEQGIQDFNGFKAYAEAVDAYIKAAQKYIDGATNDANDIINKRNEAVKRAQDAIDQYNAFFDKEQEVKS